MQRTCLYRTSGAVSQTNSSQPVFSEVALSKPSLGCGHQAGKDSRGVYEKGKAPGLSTQIPKEVLLQQRWVGTKNLGRRGPQHMSDHKG